MLLQSRGAQPPALRASDSSGPLPRPIVAFGGHGVICGSAQRTP